MLTNDYEKEYFTANKIAKLIGINKNQFFTFKDAGLIEFKNRYSVNDAIYTSFTNSFRNRITKWSSILKFYNEVFGSVENVRSLDFLNNDVITIHIENDSKNYVFRTRNDSLVLDLYKAHESYRKHNVFNNNNECKFNRLNYYFRIDNDEIYLIFINEIVKSVENNLQR